MGIEKTAKFAREMEYLNFTEALSFLSKVDKDLNMADSKKGLGGGDGSVS